MKRTVKILAVSLVFVMLAMLLVACRPNRDYNKAKENLEKNGYSVELTIKSTEIAAFEASAEVENVDAVLVAYKEVGDKLDGITIIYFKDVSSAKKAVEQLKDESVGLSVDAFNSEYVKCSRSGKLVYTGTKNAINDTGWFFLP